jgi:hypothetical protein
MIPRIFTVKKGGHTNLVLMSSLLPVNSSFGLKLAVDFDWMKKKKRKCVENGDDKENVVLALKMKRRLGEAQSVLGMERVACSLQRA